MENMNTNTIHDVKGFNFNTITGEFFLRMGDCAVSAQIAPELLLPPTFTLICRFYFVALGAKCLQIAQIIATATRFVDNVVGA